LLSLRLVSHLVLGQYANSVARSLIVRLSVGLLFVVPATRAGYHVTLAPAHFGTPSEWWREWFAMLGAVAVGSLAWARVSILTQPALRPGRCVRPAQPAIGATSRGRWLHGSMVFRLRSAEILGRLT
jgi:hypothetical protein